MILPNDYCLTRSLLQSTCNSKIFMVQSIPISCSKCHQEEHVHHHVNEKVHNFWFTYTNSIGGYYTVIATE